MKYVNITANIGEVLTNAACGSNFQVNEESVMLQENVSRSTRSKTAH
jgi:hypothetical protein